MHPFSYTATVSVQGCLGCAWQLLGCAIDAQGMLSPVQGLGMSRPGKHGSQEQPSMVLVMCRDCQTQAMCTRPSLRGLQDGSFRS